MKFNFFNSTPKSVELSAASSKVIDVFTNAANELREINQKALANNIELDEEIEELNERKDLNAQTISNNAKVIANIQKILN